MKFLLPQGIGDSVWALLKIQDISKKLGDGIVDVLLNTLNSDPKEDRALPFLRRLKFIRNSGQHFCHILLPGDPVDENGYYRYIPDRLKMDGIDFTLMPNAHLERGLRIEDWLPEFETNWKIMDEFQFDDRDKDAAERASYVGDFCVFYLGSEHANTLDGHNRGPIWTPEDWRDLGRLVLERFGLKIAVVGATYDESYYRNFVEPLVSDQGWIDLIGKLPISSTFAVIRQSKFVVSFQSGIGIVAEYMGIPAALFWRQKGDSISSHFYLSFEEAMNGAWSPPEMISSGKHFPLFYGRHKARDVISGIEERKWLC